MSGTYKVTKIISQTTEKFTAMVEFNEKPEQLSEVDFDTLDRAAVAIQNDKATPVNELAKLRGQSPMFLEAIEKLKAMLEEEQTEEVKTKLAKTLENSEKALLSFQALVADKEAEIDHLDALSTEVQTTISNRPVYVDSQLQKIADADAERTLKENTLLEEIKLVDGQIVL